ncbi:hypothetical protein ABZ851_01505 [Streptomyces sp. NPDC047049]|uniref:hypothetical protein n=1 Tax=Streptomyces sp. NPDC047049 TaxID=3156688 RepID=UPI0033D072B6
MRSGALFARRMSAPPTSATAYSSSPGLPTPAARDFKGGGQRGQLPTAVGSLLPTPSTSENTGAGHAAQGGMNLRHVVSLLPTPRASENENRQTRRSPSQEAGTHGKSLAAEMGSLLPTPRATDGTKGAVSRTEATHRRVQSGTANLPEVALSAFPKDPPSGASTPKRSRGGKRSSSAPPPGQLTLWDG